MKIAAVCVTYDRPKLLGRMIRCFELQDHDDRELIILDDAGQYGNRQGDRWHIVSVNRRFRTLGEKRNAATALISPDTKAIAVWDDDDVYLPWQLSACVATLSRPAVVWAQPRQVLEIDRPGQFVRRRTFADRDPQDIGYHAGWAYIPTAFTRERGYGAFSNGEDREFAQRMRSRFGESADAISSEYPAPAYVYSHRRTGSKHLSAMGPGNAAYDRRGADEVDMIGEIPIEWPDDYTSWAIGDDVLPRRW